MIRWNAEKASWLRRERDIDMAEIARLIESEQFLAIEKVPSQVNHPEQLMFVVLLNDYVCCVPFVIESTGDIFIKTVFPSRRLNAKYNRGENNE